MSFEGKKKDVRKIEPPSFLQRCHAADFFFFFLQQHASPHPSVEPTFPKYKKMKILMNFWLTESSVLN